MTRSPTPTRVTFFPQSTTTPLNSIPGMQLFLGAAPYSPRTVKTSAKFSPMALTAMAISLAAGGPISSLTSRNRWSDPVRESRYDERCMGWCVPEKGHNRGRIHHVQEETRNQCANKKHAPYSSDLHTRMILRGPVRSHRHFQCSWCISLQPVGRYSRTMLKQWVKTCFENGRNVEQVWTALPSMQTNLS